MHMLQETDSALSNQSLESQVHHTLFNGDKIWGFKAQGSLWMMNDS